VPLGWGAGYAVTREMGVWFREAETESEIVEPNRKASIGYLAYMVK
jgi:hypothetical protein